MDTNLKQHSTYTKAHITEENSKNRKQNKEWQVLAPIGPYVYDVTLMYQTIRANIGELLPKRVTAEYAEEMLLKVAEGPSSYLGTVGTCGSLGIPTSYIEEVKLSCVRGSVDEPSSEECQQKFRENISCVLESLNELYNSNGHCSNVYISTFRDNCNQCLQEKYVFEDKRFTPVTQYQNHIDFPKPKAFTKKKLDKPVLSAAEMEMYVQRNASMVIDSMRDTIDSYTEKLQTENGIQKDVLQYLLIYCKLFVKCCEEQVRESPPMVRSEVIDRSVDKNQVEFPLPRYSKTQQMRIFLDDYQPMIFEVTSDEYVEPMLYETSTEEVNDYFEDLLAKRCSEAFITDIDAECTWETFDNLQNVIKDDIVTDKQLLLIKSREARTDLQDLDKMKERHEKHLRYFQLKYGLCESGINSYKNWISIVLDNEKEFLEVCEGNIKPRVVIDKVAMAELVYNNILSAVPIITEEQKDKMKQVRESKLMYFIQRYNLCNDKIQIYRQWADRMEDNLRQLQDLCELNNVVWKKAIVIKNHSALFTSYSTFEVESQSDHSESSDIIDNIK